jgi:exodeoxyribonuclease-3
LAGVRIATWNINSLKVRLGRVEQWLDEVRPDVLCLQETKLADGAFPSLAFEALGYSSVHHGQGQWNGVAILSRVGLGDMTSEFADGGPSDPEARFIAATCGGVRVHCVYVPNGRALDDDHYQYKLAWLARLEAHLANTRAPNDAVVVAGDFNIAPADLDVWKPEAFAGATHVSDDERAALARLTSWGLRDVVREQHPSDQFFSWWDYRAGDFHQGRGMRIDLILATAPVADHVTWAVVDRNARKGQQPSDHAPVLVDVAVPA